MAEQKNIKRKAEKRNPRRHMSKRKRKSIMPPSRAQMDAETPAETIAPGEENPEDAMMGMGATDPNAMPMDMNAMATPPDQITPEDQASLAPLPVRRRNPLRRLEQGYGRGAV